MSPKRLEYETLMRKRIPRGKPVQTWLGRGGLWMLLDDVLPCDMTTRDLANGQWHPAPMFERWVAVTEWPDATERAEHKVWWRVRGPREVPS